MSTTGHIDLRYLDPDHPLRNALLVNIGAEFKHFTWADFKPIVRGAGKFEDKTYNDLTRIWQDAFKWRAPQ